jgi:hypothetical protein
MRDFKFAILLGKKNRFSRELAKLTLGESLSMLYREGEGVIVLLGIMFQVSGFTTFGSRLPNE